jgi:hypothetical protein
VDEESGTDESASLLDATLRVIAASGAACRPADDDRPLPCSLYSVFLAWPCALLRRRETKRTRRETA